MNNIEILEHKLKLNEKTKFDWFGEKEFKAIENLIQENKELRIQISARETVVDKLTKENKELNNKILNFINNELPDDEICECCSNYDVNGVRLKNELKKLLEGGE
jgi:hypothetical protein